MKQIDFNENIDLHVKYTADDYGEKPLDFYIKTKDINKVVISFFNNLHSDVFPYNNTYTIDYKTKNYMDKVELNFNHCKGINEYDDMLNQMCDIVDYDQILDETNQYRNFKFIDEQGKTIDLKALYFVYCDIEITNNGDGTAKLEYVIADVFDNVYKTDNMLLDEMRVVPLAERTKSRD